MRTVERHQAELGAGRGRTEQGAAPSPRGRAGGGEGRSVCNPSTHPPSACDPSVHPIDPSAHAIVHPLGMFTGLRALSPFSLATSAPFPPTHTPKNTQPAIRAQVLAALLQADDPLIRPLLAEALYSIAGHDYPDRWPQLLGARKRERFLLTPTKRFTSGVKEHSFTGPASVLLSLSNVYEWRGREVRPTPFQTHAYIAIRIETGGEKAIAPPPNHQTAMKEASKWPTGTDHPRPHHRQRAFCRRCTRVMPWRSTTPFWPSASSARSSSTR